MAGIFFKLGADPLVGYPTHFLYGGGAWPCLEHANKAVVHELRGACAYFDQWAAGPPTRLRVPMQAVACAREPTKILSTAH